MTGQSKIHFPPPVPTISSLDGARLTTDRYVDCKPCGACLAAIVSMYPA